MGCNCGFIAFDQRPDVGEGHALTKYRLFKRAGKSEWYLDGPNRGVEFIPFFERPSLDEQKLREAWIGATREYSALVAETNDRATERTARTTS